jgi:Phage related hypothetical protein (DUF1799)
MEAGYRYASGAGEQAEDYNEADEVPDWWKARMRGSDFYLNYDYWPAFDLFRRCSTQWRVSPMGQRTGLDYSAVLSLAMLYGVNDHDTFDQVQSLELGALAAYMGKTLESLLNG